MLLDSHLVPGRECLKSIRYFCRVEFSCIRDDSIPKRLGLALLHLPFLPGPVRAKAILIINSPRNWESAVLRRVKDDKMSQIISPIDLNSEIGRAACRERV